MEKSYTTKDLTKILLICRQSIYKAIKMGELVGERRGRGYKFTENDIENYRRCRRTAGDLLV